MQNFANLNKTESTNDFLYTVILNKKLLIIRTSRDLDEFVCEIESGLSELCCILGTESVFRFSGKTRRIKIINYFLVFYSYNSG